MPVMTVQQAAEQLLKGLQQYQLVDLLACLSVWLQQKPEVRLEQCASSSSNSSRSINSSSPCMLLWSWCMVCVCDVRNIIRHAWIGEPDAHALALPYIEDFTCALDKAGEDAGTVRCAFCTDT